MKEQTVKRGDMNTRTEQKHTALPWKLSDGLTVSDPEKCDKYGAPLTICKINSNTKDPFCETANGQEALANAEFIVKACNNFYIHEELMKQGSQKIDELIQQKNELVEALREITSEFEIMHPILHPNNETLTKAKQALEKAGA